MHTIELFKLNGTMFVAELGTSFNFPCFDGKPTFSIKKAMEKILIKDLGKHRYQLLIGSVDVATYLGQCQKDGDPHAAFAYFSQVWGMQRLICEARVSRFKHGGVDWEFLKSDVAALCHTTFPGAR